MRRKKHTTKGSDRESIRLLGAKLTHSTGRGSGASPRELATVLRTVASRESITCGPLLIAEEGLRAAEVGLLELVLLNDCTHGTVDDHDALRTGHKCHSLHSARKGAFRRLFNHSISRKCHGHPLANPTVSDTQSMAVGGRGPIL